MKRDMFGRLVLLIVSLAVLVPLVLVAEDDEMDAGEVAVMGQTPESPTDSIYQLINASYQDVRPIFERSCFDCHSSFTDFPWYHSLPLIGGMLDHDVKEGRDHLDLSNDFPFGSVDDQSKGLREIKDEIEGGDMPLLGYRMMHWGRAIEGERRDSVFGWIDESLKLLQSHTETQPGH
jgi:hypothetical protein